MGSWSFDIAVLLALVSASGLLSLAQAALASARRAKLQQQSEQGHRGAAAALELLAAPQRVETTVRIGVAALAVLAGAYGGATLGAALAGELGRIAWLAPFAGTAAVLLVVIAVAFLSLVLGEFVPRRIAQQRPERIAAGAAPVLQGLLRLASPVARLLTLAANLVLRLLKIDPAADVTVSEEEIKEMIEIGTQEGVFEPAEQELVERVFRLADRSVSALMTPRPDVVALDLEDTAEEIQRKITDGGHTHYPVVSGRIDNILGMVNSKDLLTQNLACRPIDLKAVLRPPLFVPESMPALDVLERFRKKRVHVAFVIDEHGGFQGLVTTSDLLEAIVGDMPVPDGTGEAEIVRREDGSFLVDGAVIADEVKKLLALNELPFEDDHAYETLGGLVMAFLERIPAAGDHFEWKGFRFEVVDMDGHRVDKVLIAPLPAPEPPRPAAERGA
jgi:putative hemolysin